PRHLPGDGGDPLPGSPDPRARAAPIDARARAGEDERDPRAGEVRLRSRDVPRGGDGAEVLLRLRARISAPARGLPPHPARARPLPVGDGGRIRELPRGAADVGLARPRDPSRGVPRRPSARAPGGRRVAPGTAATPAAGRARLTRSAP